MKVKTKDGLTFLDNLQKELLAQGNDWTASPVFWAIRDYKWVSASEFECDRTVIWDDEGNRYTDENLATLVDRIVTDDNVDLLVYHADIDEVFAFIEDYVEDHPYTLQHEVKVEEIKKSTFFLTKREAQEHLDANYYHYTDEAGTYAMSAWRAPQVSKLWKVLRELDFASLVVEDTTTLEAYILDEWVRVDRVEGGYLVITDSGGYPNLYPIDTTKVRDV